MRWEVIEGRILDDMEDFTRLIQSMAPKNSVYVSKDRGKVVDYIYVDGKRVRSNTNTLFNSIVFSYNNTNGKDIIAQTKVQGNIPYYERAVLSQRLDVASHYGRIEYGSQRYADSEEFSVLNRNYMYYMEGEHLMRALVNKWNGLEIPVSNKIGDFL